MLTIDLWDTASEGQSKPEPPKKTSETVRYCTFYNTCCKDSEDPKRYLCCHYCSVKSCVDRCIDNPNKCKYILDEPNLPACHFKTQVKKEKEEK